MSPDAAGTSPAFDQPADCVYHPDLLLGVLEHHRVNYFAAPPRIGKFCLLYPQLAQYLECRKFLGCTDGLHEAPRFGLITQDSIDHIRDRIKSMGLHKILTTQALRIEHASRGHRDDFHLTSIVEEALMRLDNKPQMVLIDNLHHMLPSGEVSKFKEPGDFILELNQLAVRYNTTFLATVPMSKQKMNEGYSRPIDRIVGSVNWLHGAGTISCLDYPNGRVNEATTPRKLTITFHGKPEQESYWRFSNNKLVFVPLAQILGELPQRDVSVARNARLSTLLSSYPHNEELPINTLFTWAEGEGGNDSIPDATLYRWIDEQITIGRLLRVRKGVYLRAKPS